MQSKTQKFILSIIIAAALLIGAVSVFIVYQNSTKKDTPLVYSSNQMLLELWNNFKQEYIEPGTNRTLDKQQDNISTSEGQSYTMLRAVWIDDQSTFDNSWQWTKDNLQRDDKLMSWKFGKLADGSYGVQNDVGGQNTATDGDSDIALSLLMAYSRWGEDKYLYDAMPIIDAMWDKEVVSINGKPVLVSNDLERLNKESVIVNPSYISPYTYKVFAKVDTKHDWNGLADNSYDLLAKVSDNKLGSESSSGLPPDWININRTTGEISAPQQSGLTTDFGYDAIRTPWRLALDYQWFKDPRDKQILSRYGFLEGQWKNNQTIFTNYAHDGTPKTNYSSPATYGATIGYFNVINPSLAQQIYKQKLTVLYNPNTQQYTQTLGYYDESWAWFGIGLQSNALTNLTDVTTKR